MTESGNWFLKALSFVNRMMGWATLIFWLALLAAVVVIKSGLVQPKEEPIALYLAMVATLVAAQSRHMVELYKRLRDRLTTQSNEIRLVCKTLEHGGRLFSLDSALADLKPELERLKAGETVTIDHLGLDMTAAWNKLSPVLRDIVESRQVVFRLLILGNHAVGGASAGAGLQIAFPEEVEDWFKKGDTRRAKIERALKDIEKRAPTAGIGGGRLDYKVRSYRDVPIVHGIRIRSPFEAAYVAVCRWDESKTEEYWWGGDEYHRVRGPATKEQLDMMAILDGYFERWWAMNPDNEVSSPGT